MSRASVPRPLPYQGSKRALAPQILAWLPADIATLHEPFAGSAALSLAALHHGRTVAVRLGDLNAPLMALWRAVVDDPAALAEGYAALWHAQRDEPAAFYRQIREAFNRDPRPERLLYLLARCVKAAVRYNARGEFNQSPDHRRLGARPARVRTELTAAATLLAGRTVLHTGDFRAALSDVGPNDVVYLDPPYQGVSTGRDARYVAGLPAAELTAVLAELVRRGVAFAVSYDGRSGDRAYGAALPAELGLTRVELDAGPSTTATLQGRRARTVESLYLSAALLARTRPGAA